MPPEELMTLNERRKYLKRMWPRYAGADRAERHCLLTEMERVTTLHRKSLIRLLNGPSLDRAPARPPRARTYGLEVERVVALVWESLDYVCAERLTPALLSTAQHLAGFGELTLTPALEAHLAAISCSTVQRLLTRLWRTQPRLPQRGPERANAVAGQVPVERIAWETQEAGHFEVDLVHHCGTSTNGEYVHTLQMVDVASGWSERVAIWGRSQRAMEAGFTRILARVPVVVREVHSDNGAEFLNAHLVRFWGRQAVPVRLTRSRPDKKNDNRFVEQKNDTLVRAYFGQERLETAAQAAALNGVYEQMWVYYNLFQPVLHQISKEVVEGKVVRQWDVAQTPYRRLVASGQVQGDAGTRLAQLYAETNPRRLRTLIHEAIPRLWQLGAPPVEATAQVPERRRAAE